MAGFPINIGVGGFVIPSHLVFDLLAFDFDVRAIKKSCVHIVHKDGRIIPFETMNLFYRDEKEKYLKELQREVKW